jgi:hydroxymethylpyrimidine/phosphomethylpyrimidine kinase
LTVQSTAGVRAVEPVDAEWIVDTLEELCSDVDVAAVHIGMLATGKVAAAVAGFLARKKLPNIVLDPILESSSGASLLDKAGRRFLIDDLFPMATVITPNTAEASAITGERVTDADQMKAAAAKLHEMGASAVVVTGGDLEKAIDLLSFRDGHAIVQQQIFKAERHISKSTHGTGCAFSTTIACHLAQGRGLPEAVLLAKIYVAAAIVNAVPVGRGTGPVHHLYRMHQQRRPSTTGELVPEH